jgi:peptidoglycan/xylan/chitin deacetylase (PgdA/CDA1 family)
MEKKHMAVVMRGSMVDNTITLPAGMLSASGLELEGFDTVAQWTPLVGTIATDTTNFRTGTASLQLTPAVGSYCSATKTVSWNFGTAPQRLRLYFYMPVAASYYSAIKIYISSSTSVAKSFQRNLSPFSGFHIGWNVADIYPTDWTNNSSEDWANTMVRFRVRVDATTGNSQPLSFDSIVSGIDGFSAVVVQFDDNSPTVYSEGYAYCHPLGIRCTNYCISGHLGEGGYLTNAQLQEMYAGGWTIGNHTKNHGDLTLLSQSDVIREVTDCKVSLDALGFTNTSNYFAYPHGTWNESVIAGLKVAGMLTGRTIWGSGYSYPMGSLDNMFTMGVQPIGNAVTLATAKTYLDNAFSQKKVLGLLFHGLVNSPGTDDWTPSDFQALIDYGKLLGLPFITIHDLYRTLFGTVLVPKI